MYNELRKAAVSATLNIFETMFFTFLEPLESPLISENTIPEPDQTPEQDVEAPDSGFLKSEIHFYGILSGFLRLYIPYDFSRVLAMNFMGFEEEVSESQIEDMAGELSNMVCGNIFSLLDKAKVYTLSSPSTQRISFLEKKETGNSEDFVLDFNTEGHTITLVIHFNS